MEVIYRDDDPNVYTCFAEFKRINEIFKKNNKKHTVAVIMKDLWQNHALFYYLATEKNIIVGLHGWEHKDYSTLSAEECYEDLKKSLNYWYENTSRMVGFTKQIDTFFAPWNRDSKNIRWACERLGLHFCNVKSGEWNGKKIKSFHWWSFNESVL